MTDSPITPGGPSRGPWFDVKFSNKTLTPKRAESYRLSDYLITREVPSKYIDGLVATVRDQMKCPCGRHIGPAPVAQWMRVTCPACRVQMYVSGNQLNVWR